MSSISTLMEASSSAAVLLGFFIGHLAAITDAVVPILGSEIPRSNEDRARPSNLNTFLMTLFDPGIFPSHVSRARRGGGLSMLPGG
jgi:hypothetical protein